MVKSSSSSMYKVLEESTIFKYLTCEDSRVFFGMCCFYWLLTGFAANGGNLVFLLDLYDIFPPCLSNRHNWFEATATLMVSLADSASNYFSNCFFLTCKRPSILFKMGFFFISLAEYYPRFYSICLMTGRVVLILLCPLFIECILALWL